MNKSILALSTALSIFTVAPAFAQESPAVDCTIASNAQDPACVNKQNNQNSNQSGETGSGTTGTMSTDQNNAQTGTGTGTATDQNNAQTGTGTATDQNNAQTGTGTGTTIDQNNAQTGTGTMSTDQNNAQTGTGTSTTTSTQMGSTDLIVPADRLNNAQVMSASDYIGKAVYDETGANIGEVNDLIISQMGDIQAVILGVGGFLGMGEKDVAVAVNAVQMVKDGEANRLVVKATKDELEAAPTYDRTNRRYATDGTTAPADNTGSTTIAPAPGTVPAGGADNDPNTPQ